MRRLQMLDPMFTTDRIAEHLHRLVVNRAVNTLPLSLRICSGAQRSPAQPRSSWSHTARVRSRAITLAQKHIRE